MSYELIKIADLKEIPTKDDLNDEDALIVVQEADTKRASFVNIMDAIIEKLDVKNAYDVAVKTGYTGTVEEWLETLRGDGISSVDLQALTGKFQILDVTWSGAEGTSTYTITNSTESLKDDCLNILRTGENHWIVKDGKVVSWDGLLQHIEDKASETLSSAKAYTDKKISDLVGSAPEALNTIQELAEALGNADAVTSLTTELGKKANKADLGTAAYKNVPTSGDASATQVVMGNDSRLTDEKVAQGYVATNTTHPLLASYQGNNTTSRTTSSVYTNKIYMNPSTGQLNATKFAGSGAGLTALPAAKLTGTAPASVLPEATTSTKGAMTAADKSKVDYANVAYCTCDTAAATAAKVITPVGNTNWALQTGAIIIVKFTYTNTAENPTFNVNGKGAKSVSYNNAVITTANLGWGGFKDRPMLYFYDGTNWVWFSMCTDSDAKAYQVYSTDNVNYPLLASYNANSTSSRTVTTRFTNKIYLNPSTGLLTATKFSGSGASLTALPAGNLTGTAPASVLPEATTSAKGAMSATDKSKMDYTNVAYCTCDTAAATAAKIVTPVGNTNWILQTGAIIIVKCTYTNTANNPTFNVNGTGAKSIMISWNGTNGGSSIITTGNLGFAGHSVMPMIYFYDGTNWVWISKCTDDNMYVQQYYASDNVNYPLLASHIKSGTANRLTASRFTDKIYLNPSTGLLTATKFSGSGASLTALPAGNLTGTVPAYVLPEATQSARGAMSIADKTKLDYTNVGYGTCDTAAATAAKEVTTVNTNWSLQPGALVYIKFTYTNTGANPTLNVNGTGAFSINYNNAIATTHTLHLAGEAGRVIVYMYDGTNWVWMGHSRDTSNTYTAESLGFGWGACGTARDTLAKAISDGGFKLTIGAMYSVRFSYAVPAGSTLNINGTGAKPIAYYNEQLWSDYLIGPGDVCLFVYEGTNWRMIMKDDMNDYDINSDEIDLNILTLTRTRPTRMRYVCRTNAGAALKTNKPAEFDELYPDGCPFVLELTQTRWTSATDYICIQEFTDLWGTNVWYRYDRNGTWSEWQKRNGASNEDVSATPTEDPHRTSGTVGTGYYHRNIAYGTSSTPTSDATYGGSGSIWFQYTS